MFWTVTIVNPELWQAAEPAVKVCAEKSCRARWMMRAVSLLHQDPREGKKKEERVVQEVVQEVVQVLPFERSWLHRMATASQGAFLPNHERAQRVQVPVLPQSAAVPHANQGPATLRVMTFEGVLQKQLHAEPRHSCETGWNGHTKRHRHFTPVGHSTVSGRNVNAMFLLFLI